AFTQPKMYDAIKSHPSAREVWAARLVREGRLTADDVKAMDKRVADALGVVFAQVQAQSETRYTPAEPGPTYDAEPETAVPADRLVTLNERLHAWPSSFHLHPTLQRTLSRRRESLQTG